MSDSTEVLAEKAIRIRLVCTDVDGVLTDGGMYYSENGDELKKFNTRDGMGVALLHAAGIKVAMITGENTQLVARRAAKLKVQYLYQDIKDKRKIIMKLMSQLQLTWPQIAFIGDDINDLEVLRCVGLSATVPDGLDIVKQNVSYICRLSGGGGAFREFAELILQSQEKDGSRECNSELSS